MTLSSLPDNWASASLANLIASDGFISDGDWVESKDQDPIGNVRLIQLADIGDGYFRNKSERFMNVENAKRMNCTFLKSGDVLIARMPDPLGRACIFPGVGQEAVTVVDICLVRLGSNSAINNELLMHWINSFPVRNLIALESTGTTRKRITRRKLEEFDLPVPPLAEQKKIVAKLNELLAKVDTLQARLNAIPVILKRFRHSVLAAAVSGKLTEEWKEENNARPWRMDSLKNLCSKVGSGSTPKGGGASYKRSGVPLIRSMNVIFFGFKYEGIAFLDESQAKELRNVEVKANDVLLNITGASIGRVTLAPADVDGARVNQHVCIVRPAGEIISEFMCMFLSSPSMQLLMGGENYGATRQALTKQQILDFQIPVPAKSEQTEIIRRVEELFAFADQVEQRARAVTRNIEPLRQSILAKAFRGELTAQWRAQHPELISGENSAQVLLSRIKSEREAMAMQSKKRKLMVEKKGSRFMSKQIISVVEALKLSGKPMAAQELLAAAGYPNDSDTEKLEKFFLDIRQVLIDKEVVKHKRDENGQDWFALAE